MGNPADERDVFAGFLAADPMFAGVAVKSWGPAADEPADIDCELVDGRKIGIQLTTWIDEQQIKAAKDEENLETPFLEALDPLPPNDTEHFYLIWIFPKTKLRRRDTGGFRTELLQLVKALDARWESEPDWQSPQGFQWSDFGQYRLLAKYLTALDVHPRMPSVASTMEKGKPGWITVEPPGGNYGTEIMVDALCDVIEAKVKKYVGKARGMSELHLLVHFDKAYTYNSPVEGIDFRYPEAVKAAAARVGDKVGLFAKIFVFVPIAEQQKVFQLYP